MRASFPLLSAVFVLAVVPAVKAADSVPSPTSTADMSAVVSQADADYKAKAYDKAIPEYAQVVASSQPEGVRVLAQARIARSHFYQGHKAEALKAYLAVADTFPNQPGFAAEALYHAGEIAASLKDYDGAITHLQRAVKTYAHASEYARKEAAQAQNRLGFVYLARRVPDKDHPQGVRQLSKAVASFEVVVKDFADQPETVAEARKQLVALKLEYAINGKASYQDAQALAEGFLRSYPEDKERVPVVRMVRAESLFHQGRYDEAIAEIGTIQSQYPGSGQPYGTSQFLLAQCYDRKGDYARAVTEYQSFLNNVKQSFSAWEERPGALYGIASCYRSLGQPEAARHALDMLKEQYPDSYFVKMAAQDDGFAAGGAQ